MAYDTQKSTTQRSWPLNLIPADPDPVTPVLWVRHTVSVTGAGTPGEVTEHDWELELRFPRVGRDAERTKVTIVKAAGQAEFDDGLNKVRQAMVDARAGLGEM